MNTHDNQPFDLGAALHEIANDAGRSPADPIWGTTTHTRIARLRRRHHILVATVTAGVLAIGGATWVAIPHLTRDPLPAVTHTPTPSPTPTPTPEPSPTATTTPISDPPAVPHGYTTENVELPLEAPTWTGQPGCGDQVPTQTGAERLVKATVPAETITLAPGEESGDMPMTLSVPDTVKLKGAVAWTSPLMGQDGVIMTTAPGGDGAPVPFTGEPGESVTMNVAGGMSLVGCEFAPGNFEENLPPGRYTVTTYVFMVVDAYSLQQQDGTWGAWQTTTPAKNRLPLVANTVTLVIK